MSALLITHTHCMRDHLKDFYEELFTSTFFYFTHFGRDSEETSLVVVVILIKINVIVNLLHV